jgi:hypothetical protein
MAHRARLDELKIGAAEDCAQAELDLGRDATSLVVELSQLSVSHPLRERSRALLIRALQAAGRSAEALIAYEEFRARLANELGTDPGPEVQAAHLAVLQAEGGPDPKASRRGNLRVPLVNLVGRTVEHAQLSELLAQGRLVTLVGPGGAGKTRLAEAVAADLAGRFPGGVWMVELAQLTGSDDVARALLAALDHRDLLPSGVATSGAPQGRLDRLGELLGVEATLLVLDNCEHLIDGAAQLASDLLGRCPRLHVLATSREPFAIGGE